MKKLNQTGSHIVAISLAIVVLGAIGFVGWRVLSKKNDQPNAHDTVNTQQPSQKQEASTGIITWQSDGKDWKPSAPAPKCPDPLVFEQSPTNVSMASAILYPGQSRGGNYKPHGGFRFDGRANNEISVIAPIDASLTEASRYIEQGEVQYMLRFTNSCGISYRFDHLLTLSAAMQAEANKLPEPKVDDSRTTPINTQISVKVGDVIATAVGFKNTKNVGFDFGVYDLRQRNKAAQDPNYVSKHENEFSQAGFAVCWFDMLPTKDAAVVKGLPAGDQANGKTSDYCK